MGTLRIHIVEPAGAPDRELLAANIEDLRRRGVAVRHTPMGPEADWSYASGSAAARAEALSAALCQADCDFVVAARGGYGASDLLPLIDWARLAEMEPRCLVGLSDITALQVALYARLGWRALHGVMPGGALWRPGTDHTEHLIALLGGGLPWRDSLAVTPLSTTARRPAVEGVLLGGCLSVLTALIGTPYAPASWQGFILFVEDINENPGRLMRYWNQWRQSDALEGLRAVVVGQLAGVGERTETLAQFARRSPCPVYACDAFGHEAPSFAVGQGAVGRISNGRLFWEIDRI